MKKSETPTVQASGLFHRMFGVGVRAGNSLPVRKLMLAVVVPAIATFLGIFAVAQTQAADGTMDGVTLASDSPGDLTVSWNAPSPAPTDYRVRWAPVESGYLSWTADNETERGNEYPAGDATSLTLSGLPEGTEFKVQARARYHKGKHKDSPWSGPWAVASALVMSQLPDVPNGARDARGAQHRGDRADPRWARLAVVAEPVGRFDHRLPGPAGPGRRLPCRHRRGYGLERDQLHGHGASRGSDPHLRREGAQRLGAEPPVRHGHGDGAGTRT